MAIREKFVESKMRVSEVLFGPCGVCGKREGEGDRTRKERCSI